MARGQVKWLEHEADLQQSLTKDTVPISEVERPVEFTPGEGKAQETAYYCSKQSSFPI